MVPLKPKIVQDVRRQSGRSPFEALPRCLNLASSPVARLPLIALLKEGVVLLNLLFLLGGSVLAPTAHVNLYAASVGNHEERRTLEAQLQELERQIDDYESQIVSYQKRGKNLKGEINRLNNEVAKLNLQVKAINLTLTELNRQIGETVSRISIAEDSIRTNKHAMAELLRNIHRKEQVNLVAVLLEKPTLSDFFNDLNNFALLEGNLHVTVQKIETLHEELTEHKTQLALSRADAETIRIYRENQKRETEKVKEEKGELLTITKGEESRYQNLLKATKEKAREIRNRIFQLLGGGELTFEEAYRYAKLAGNATGVRPAFILAVLDRESALGQNVGKCSYKTAMHPQRDTPIFLEITKKLNINPEAVTVSCPNSDGAYGGGDGTSPVHSLNLEAL